MPPNITKRPLVLVVDDDVATRTLMSVSLKKADFYIEEAKDGIQAIAMYEKLDPNIIIMDVDMPNMDGFSACRKLRQHPRGKHVPIIMVTGLDDVHSVNKSYDVGATDFIVKPINWTVFGHRVRYIFRASSAFIDLQKSEEKNQAFLQTLPDTMLRISKDGTLLDFQMGQNVNHIVYFDNKSIGKNMTEILQQDSAFEFQKNIKNALDSRVLQSFDYTSVIDNNICYYETRMMMCGENEVLAIVRDVTERKKTEEKIYRMAYYDSLTGLPNRRLFLDRLEQVLAFAKRHKTLVAIFFIDLDRFKYVNDTLGHQIGDALLKSVSERLKSSLRTTDSLSRINHDDPLNNLARLGGDEFTAILADINTVENVAIVAQRIVTALASPISLDGQEINITPSIGISIFPLDGTNIDILLKNADIAMYHAKEEGRNNYKFFTDATSKPLEKSATD